MLLNMRLSWHHTFIFFKPTNEEYFRYDPLDAGFAMFTMFQLR